MKALFLKISKIKIGTLLSKIPAKSRESFLIISAVALLVSVGSAGLFFYFLNDSSTKGKSENYTEGKVALTEMGNRIEFTKEGFYPEKITITAGFISHGEPEKKYVKLLKFC